MRRVTHSSHSCGSLWINNADIAIIIMIVIFAFTLTHTSSVTPTSGSQRDPNQWITALSRTWFLRFCPCPRPCPCPCPCPAHFAVRGNILTRTLVLVLVRSSICFSRRLDPYMFLSLPPREKDSLIKEWQMSQRGVTANDLCQRGLNPFTGVQFSKD